MEKETKENLNSEIEETEESTSTNDEDISDDVEEEHQDDNSDLEELKSKNKQLYERVKKAEAERKKLDALNKAYKEQKQEKKDTGTLDVYSVAKQVAMLKDYSEDELDIIDRHAKAFGLSYEEALKNKDVQTLIDYKRQENQDNIPTPSNRQSTEKLDARNLTPEQIAGLDPANNPDHLELLDQYRKSRRQG